MWITNHLNLHRLRQYCCCFSIHVTSTVHNLKQTLCYWNYLVLQEDHWKEEQACAHQRNLQLGDIFAKMPSQVTFHILWNLLHKDGTNHCSRVSSIESIACYPRKRCFPQKIHKSFKSIVHTHNLCGLCCPSYTPTTKTIHLFQLIVTAAQIDLLFIPCNQAEGVSNWRWTSVGCVGFPTL